MTTENTPSALALKCATVAHDHWYGYAVSPEGKPAVALKIDTTIAPLLAENARLRAALRAIGIRAHAEAGGKDRPGYVAIYHAADSALDTTQ